MNTQERVHRLEAGQALPQSRRNAGTAVLAEGELLVQAPARWLAGSVFVPPAVRFVAPAVLPATPSCSVIALSAAKVVVQERESLFTLARLRRVLGRWTADNGRRARGHLPA